ncbi:MAG: ATP-dependent helicase [Candidatus Nitrosocaldaceae archaeon]
MLEYEEAILERLDPVVKEWFVSRFNGFTPPQKSSIINILNCNSVLVASPTGSGKTLSAFLAIINNLVRFARDNTLEDKVYCIYISPLRSLNNDIAKNLKVPLEELGRMHDAIKKIRIGIRTGDTTQQERAKMLRKPPHILITTPESIAIILCAPKFRELLRDVRWIIVDEIHELCSSKRGVHLSLSLERLENLANNKIVRIGLSATIHPLDEVAKYLVGYDNNKERSCYIVDTRFVKPMMLKTISPVSDLIHTSSERVNKRLYKLLKNIIENNTTTLIFTNTRSGTERVVYHLSKMNIVDADQLAAHHSSLSRDNRLDVENRLKEGKMRAVVTSTSLELGIDIGSIDVVAQIGSPKSIARCLQRVGRSGHSIDRESRGYLIALERDDLVEDVVICMNAMKGRIDKIYIPKNALDVLAQHIVGMAVEQRWKVSEAYSLIKRSYCYKDLSIDELRRVIKYLSGGYGLNEHKVYGKIWYDEANDEFGKRGYMARVIYATNIGTIPDEVSIKVYTANNKWVGNIEEEFLERLSKGDIFVLGGKTYQFVSAKGFKAVVKDAEGKKPTIPNWFSEMLPLSFDLGEAIGKIRGDIFKMLNDGYKENDIISLLVTEAYLDTNAAKALISYIKTEADFLKMLNVDAFPDNYNIVVENYIDEEKKQNIIFHAVFGRRVNDALARAYAEVAKRISKRNVIINVSDHAFMITITDGKLEPLEIINGVNQYNIRELLLSAIRYTEMVKRRFRHCASRSLMILRNYKGHEVTVARQQTNAEILIKLCEQLDRFPVLEETYREVMEDLMDINTAISILKDIEEKRRRFVILQKFDLPSPFSHDLIVAGYSDIVLMHDKKELLEVLHEMVISRIKNRDEDN